MNLSIILNYDWAHYEVRDYVTCFHQSKDLCDWVEWSYILTEGIGDSAINLWVCKVNEWVCCDKEGFPSDFFYMYVCLFNDMIVRVSFDESYMGVLRELYLNS